MMATDQKIRLPIDTVVFLILGFLYGRLLSTSSLFPTLNNGSITLWPGMTFLAISIDLLTVVTFLWLFFDRRWWPTQADRRRTILYAVWIAVIIGGLIVHRMVVRQATQSTNMTHDGVIQSELAARAILDGKNPYTINYRGTKLDSYVRTNIPDENTLFTHYVYPPLVALVAVPMVWVSDRAGIIVELQWLYVGVFALGIIMVMKKVTRWSIRSLVLLSTLGNPWLMFYPVAGFNDLLMFGLLMITAVCLMDRRWRVAGIIFGLVLASKQTAWFFLPLWALFLWSWWKNGDQKKRQEVLTHFWWTVGTAVLFYLPFLIANAPVLYDDLIRFPAGTISGAYPIGGSTIWQIAVVMNPDRYPFLSVPSQLVQAIIGGGFFALAVWQSSRHRTVPWWLMYTAATLFAISIVNRYDYENYLSGLTLIFLVGYILEYHSSQESSVSEPRV